MRQRGSQDPDEMSALAVGQYRSGYEAADLGRTANRANRATAESGAHASRQLGQLSKTSVL